MDILVTGKFYPETSLVRLSEGTGARLLRLGVEYASEEVLREALENAVGYLWGGFEVVTMASASSAARLRAISFPGSGYAEKIPVWEELTDRGVLIAAQVGANARAVAEYTIGLILAMLRVIPATGSPELFPEGACSAHELSALTLAVIGLGHSGRQVASVARSLGMRVMGVVRGGAPSSAVADVELVDLESALALADVVTLHANQTPGQPVLRAEHVEHMRAGSLLVNVAFPYAADVNAVGRAVSEGRLRAAYDLAPPELRKMPSQRFVASRRQVAFDTVEARARMTEGAVTSLINMLVRGDDSAVVNRRAGV